MNVYETTPPIDPKRIVRTFAVSGIDASDLAVAIRHLYASGIPVLGRPYSDERPACIARHVVISYGPTPKEAAVTVTYRY